MLQGLVDGVLGLPDMSFHQMSGICVAMLCGRVIMAETDHLESLDSLSGAPRSTRVGKGKELGGRFYSLLDCLPSWVGGSIDQRLGLGRAAAHDRVTMNGALWRFRLS